MMRLSIILLAAGLVFAQDKPGENVQPLVSEAIPVKTLTGDSFNRLLGLLSVFQNAQVQGDKDLRTIVVYAPRDVVDQMRRVVEQLDRPGSEAAIGTNIDMTLTLLRCTATPAATPAPLPPDMDSVARQLRNAASCKNVELWDALPLRLQEGKDAHQDLVMPGTQGDLATTWQIDIHPEAVYRKNQARYVRFSKVNLTLREPIETGTFQARKQYTYQQVGLRTSGEFVEGQTTVVGKVSSSVDGDSIFALIELRVLN